MKCEECRELLWIYLEWETTPKESAEIKAHLAECPECRREAAKQMAFMETFRSLPEAELPEGYHAELMQKIMAEAPAAEETAKGEPSVEPAIAVPAEWKVIRKTEIIQKAQEERDLQGKRQNIWKRWSLVAAAVLVVVMAGGVGSILRMRQEPIESAQAVPAEGRSGETADVAADIEETITVTGSGEAEEDKMPTADLGAEKNAMARENGAAEGKEQQVGTDVQKIAAPVPESMPAAPERASAGQNTTVPASPVESAPRMMGALDVAVQEDADTTEGTDFDEAAIENVKPGDMLTLRAENGRDVRGSLSGAVKRNAGFEEDTGNANGILAMIPVENIDAFYEDLQGLGKIEWQAQGQEELGATYRRVEILVETE